MVWAIVIGLIVLVIAYAAATEFQSIAEKKGYRDSNKYLWWTFFVFPVGALMVIALPDRNAPQVVVAPTAPAPVTPAAPKKTVKDELPEL